jgi:hypothetical protein
MVTKQRSTALAVFEVLCLAAAPQLAAQPVLGCAAVACPLRVEELRAWRLVGGSSEVAVKGASGNVVARFGAFRHDVGRVPWASDSARHYASLYRRRARRSTAAHVIGLVTVTAGSVLRFTDRDARRGLSATLLGSGLALGLYGRWEDERSLSALRRAVCWHNSPCPAGGTRRSK